MSSRIRVGAVVDRVPGAKYRAALAFVELAPRPPLPRARTLERPADDALEVALAAPRVCFVSDKGPLRFDDALERNVAWLREAAEALRAVAIVVSTLGDVRTSPRDRELLAAYFARLREGSERRVVWVPGGLWEPAAALALARSMGVVHGFDPLESPGANSEAAYLRVRGIGARARLGENALSAIADAASQSSAEDAFVAIESERSVREAARVRALVDERTAA